MEEMHMARHGTVEGAEIPCPSWAYPSFINKMNSKDRNKSIKIFKKFLKDNDKEIKKISDQIEEELKILNEKTN